MGGVSSAERKMPSTMSDVDSGRRIEPLFFKNYEVEIDEGNYLSTYEIFQAVTAVVGDVNLVDGAQRIGGLWRIYFFG